MQSTVKPKPTDDPHDFLVVPPDAVRVVPGEEELSDLLRAAARQQADPQIHAESGSAAAPPVPPVDTTFRPSAVNDVLGSGGGPSIGRRIGRAFAALLLAACIGAMAVGWQAFGYAGKKLIVKWTPQFVLTSLSMDKWGLSAPSSSPSIEASASDASQPAALAASEPEAVAANAASQSPDSARLLQSMARDLASVSQEVEQLKASIEQLKTSQLQMSRDAAKASESKASESKASENRAPENRVSEQNARARMLAPPRPVVARAHKPAPVPYPPAQAAAPYVPQAYVPRQPEPSPPSPTTGQQQLEPGFESAPRPPMPVRQGVNP
ncbi:MAG TPA: hypothetical protein VE111_10315 [Bradyrhizobium sp.]|nr:hypothetical protein [Bradyrhizobium sp.]